MIQGGGMVCRTGRIGPGAFELCLFQWPCQDAIDFRYLPLHNYIYDSRRHQAVVCVGWAVH